MSTALATREIDELYRSTLLADRNEAALRRRAECTRVQLLVAAETLVSLREIAESQERASEAMERLSEDLGAIEDQLDHINAGITELCDTATQTLAAVETQTDVLRAGFAGLAEKLVEQRQALIRIGETLRRPYETKAAELRDEASKWLTIGMRKDNVDGRDDLVDALRLYREVVKNPIGNQDYLAWFNIGWPLWRHEGDIAEAEKAFQRASRLSELAGDLLHVLALRHLAHMQYLQGRYSDAWQTVESVTFGPPLSHALFAGHRVDVLITATGGRILQVIKHVRSAHGWGLKEAKEQLESLPLRLIENVGIEEAEKWLSDLQGAGATAEIVPTGGSLVSQSITYQHVPFDAARYAAKLGRAKEALSLLDRCIDAEPTVIVTMFGERDFLEAGLGEILTDLTREKLRMARARADEACERAAGAIREMRAWHADGSSEGRKAVEQNTQANACKSSGSFFGYLNATIAATEAARLAKTSCESAKLALTTELGLLRSGTELKLGIPVVKEFAPHKWGVANNALIDAVKQQSGTETAEELSRAIAKVQKARDLAADAERSADRISYYNTRLERATWLSVFAKVVAILAAIIACSVAIRLLKPTASASGSSVLLSIMAPLALTVPTYKAVRWLVCKAALALLSLSKE